MESEYNSLVGQFVKTDEPDSGKAGPSRIPTYSERIGKVTVEEFELPSGYGTGSGFAARTSRVTLRMMTRSRTASRITRKGF